MTAMILSDFLLLLVWLLGRFLVSAAPWSPSNSAYNVNFNPALDPANYYGKYPSHTYFPSPDDWRGETIYQFITDRFANGDPANDGGMFGGVDLYRVDRRHGGDFLGVKNKLDYIAALGFTAIWISPIFQNLENSYHGYAQIDFTLLDDRFGTLDEFRDLVSAAHERGIRVIVDIVVNHMANLLYFEGHASSTAPFRMHTGEYRLFYRNESQKYVDFVVDNTWFGDGSYCPVYGQDGEQHWDTGDLHGSYWNSDFHHNGDLTDYGSPYCNDLGKIYGIMDDLRTTHSRVMGKITAMTKALITSTDIDGIRMDTPMQYYIPKIKQHAASLGKKNFFAFAEFYCSKNFAADMTGRGKTPSMYGKNEFISNEPNKYAYDGGINYPSYEWFQATIKNWQNNVNGLLVSYVEDQSYFDWYNPLTGQKRYRHCNFFNNHDQWRMASTGAFGFLKQDLSSFILMTWAGLPLYYYGDDQGLLTLGTALDGYSREDFMTSLAWNNLTVWGKPNKAIGDNFDMTNPHFLLVKQLNFVRKTYGIAFCDDLVERYTQTGNTNGIFFFSKRCGGVESDEQWVLGGFNTWKEALSTSSNFKAFAAEATIVNVFDPSESYVLDARGWTTGPMPVNALGFKFFVKKERLVDYPPVIASVAPPHDSPIVSEGSPAVTLTLVFSQLMNLDSLKSSVKPGDLGMSLLGLVCKTNGTKTECRVQLKCSPGIHYLLVDGNVASSQSGLKMGYLYKTRIRVGTSQNVIANSEATEDASLVSKSTGGVVFRHKAIGAAKFRVQVLGDEWSQWSDFQASSKLRGSFSTGTCFRAQYFADNSAAYFVRGCLN